MVCEGILYFHFKTVFKNEISEAHVLLSNRLCAYPETYIPGMLGLISSTKHCRAFHGNSAGELLSVCSVQYIIPPKVTVGVRLTMVRIGSYIRTLGH